MTNQWEQTAIISAGGTVVSVAPAANNHVWLATSAGIFYGNGQSWQPLAQGQPLVHVNAFTASGDTLLAGGSQGEVVYSGNGGKAWYSGQTGRLNRPVTCLVMSPDFRQNPVALAGTDGMGILRSTDGGRNWQPANFGLQDFSVIELAAAPEWGRREVVFAATGHGFYRSPNGGRAWKQANRGLEGVVVQAIAVSPNFNRDHLVLAGTETAGVFRSVDGGKSWTPWGAGLAAADPDTGKFPPINCLWLHPRFDAPPVCVAGTGDGQLYRSADGGETWSRVAAGIAPVLCLAGTGEQLFAGLHEDGLLRSEDGGQTWENVPNLAARGFTRLVGGAGQQLFAYGPLEPVYQSGDGGRTWQPLAGLENHTPVLTFAASPQAEQPCYLASVGNGLLRAAGGSTWEPVVTGEQGITAIAFSNQFSADGQVWAGNGSGQLLASRDGGQTWTVLDWPGTGHAVINLTPLPAAGGDILAAATFNAEKRQVTLWRGEANGSGWKQWLQAGTGAVSVHVSAAGPDNEPVVACVGRRCWRASAAGWETVLELNSPVIQLARLPGSNDLLLATGQQLWRSTNGSNWVLVDEYPAGQAIIDVQVLALPEAETVVCGLGTGGTVWRRKL